MAPSITTSGAVHQGGLTLRVFHQKEKIRCLQCHDWPHGQMLVDGVMM
jgi:hypothetical protein